jgi:translation initiation factor IF-2
VADGGGARPESMRERGLSVAGGGGPGAESGDGRTSGAARAGSEQLGGSAAEGKGEGKGGGPGRGGATRRGGAVGPAPTGGRRPVVARAWRSRTTCAARARAGRTERGERELTGGPRHSAGRRCR